VSSLGYWWRVTGRRSGRQIVLVALLGGLLGAVALGAVAGARGTATAYGRYLTAARISDALVNVPGKLPAEPVLRPIRLISALPGITAHATYLGLSDAPIVDGKPDFAGNAPRLLGSLDGEYFRQDKMTLLAGHLPPVSATGQIVLTRQVAAVFGVTVGGQVSFGFQRYDPSRGRTSGPIVKHTYRVAALVQIPPVLTDSTDANEAALLPPGATRQVLPFYGYAWVAVRLSQGTAGIPVLQQELASLAGRMVARERRLTRNPLAGLSFDIQRYDTLQAQVRQSIRPQVIALAIFGAIAGLAMLVLTGQGLAQLVSRSRADIATLRRLGATRAQAALAAALPGLVALVAGAVLAVAGAVALSPLAPVGRVRFYDPLTGFQADGLVLGGGVALAGVILLAVLAALTLRSARQRPAAAPAGRPSAVAAVAVRLGLPPTAVIGSCNALEPGTGDRAVPVRSAIAGAIAAVTAVVTAVVFGTSLAGLTSHPARFGWPWDIAVQSVGGYGSFVPGRMARLLAGQRDVAGWSELAFLQLPVDKKQVIPVMAIERHLRPVQPPVISGHPLTGPDQAEVGEVTLRQLGKHIGDTITVGTGRTARTLTIAGTVALPSFGLSTGDHVSLGRGVMLPLSTFYAIQGQRPRPGPQQDEALTTPSAAAIDLVRGTTAAQRAALVHRIVAGRPDLGPVGSTNLVPTAVASSISNAQQMGSQPLALALSLAAAAAVSLALTVLTLVRRRRPELALLKALGMTRGQVLRVVAWQTTLTVLIAIAVGLPLGVAAGRWAWLEFASSIGAVPVAEVPLLTLAGGLAALALAGNLLAAVPAAIAARTRSAVLLRVP
jgi:ABC-type lipoprotein release transport system permease subunit